MKRPSANTFILLAGSASVLWSATPGINLVGKGTVPGSGRDLSGLTGQYCQASDAANCVSKAILGGFGSDLTYTCHDDAYVLDAFNRGQGVSEILAINDHEFLVVERDNRSWSSLEPQAPTRKKIYKIDITGATDVSGIASLPAGALPAGVVPAAKSPFIDLLDPAFGLQLKDANAIAEKIEALAWGPDLDNGNHLLYVISDNDLSPVNPSQIFAFSIASTLVNKVDQVLPGPLYPPGQVKKALKKAGK